MSDNRYIRQTRLLSFGADGQLALQNTKVLIIGCGGLGCPVALYISRAGIKHIGLVDRDTVDISNLHRQILYKESHVGLSKVKAAKKALLEGDAEITVETYQERLHSLNYKDIISPYDVVVDCTDNFETRYLINDACILLDKPVVYGAANGWEGQVAVFNVEKSGNLRDVFPHIPTQGSIQNCEEAGVLGATTGIIGNLMAMEVIKLASGKGSSLVNQFLQYDGETNQFHKLSYSADSASRTVKISGPQQLDWVAYDQNNLDALLVDVRTAKEREAKYVESKHVPIEKVMDWLLTIDKKQQLVFFCQTGQRALKAANMAIDKGITATAIVDRIK